MLYLLLDTFIEFIKTLFNLMFFWRIRKERDKTYLGFPSIREELNNTELDLSGYSENSFYSAAELACFYKILDYFCKIKFYCGEIISPSSFFYLGVSKNCYVEVDSDGYNTFLKVFIKENNKAKWKNVSSMDGPWHSLVRASFQRLDFLMNDVKNKENENITKSFIESLENEGRIKKQ